MSSQTRIHVVDAPTLLSRLVVTTVQGLELGPQLEIVEATPGGLPLLGESQGIVWCPTRPDLGHAESRLHALLRLGVPVLALDLADNASLMGLARRAGLPVLASNSTPDEMREMFRAVFLDNPQGYLPARAGLGAETFSDSAPELSTREEEVLRLYASGALLKQIAYRMGVSLNTVKSYRARIQSKYAAVGVQLRQRLDFHIEARRRFPDLEAIDWSANNRVGAGSGGGTAPDGIAASA